MAGHNAAPLGSRVKLTIEPNLQAKVARSAFVREHLERLVEEIAKAAQETVPVAPEGEHLPAGREPGQLKESEDHGVIEAETGLPVGVVAYHAWWAAMVHFGTRHAHPNPWLQNAALNVILGRHANGGPLEER